MTLYCYRQNGCDVYLYGTLTVVIAPTGLVTTARSKATFNVCAAATRIIWETV
jgi:hypothetical protein